MSDSGTHSCPQTGWLKSTPRGVCAFFHEKEVRKFARGIVITSFFVMCECVVVASNCDVGFRAHA